MSGGVWFTEACRRGHGILFWFSPSVFFLLPCLLQKSLYSQLKQRIQTLSLNYRSILDTLRGSLLGLTYRGLTGGASGSRTSCEGEAVVGVWLETQEEPTENKAQLERGVHQQLSTGSRMQSCRCSLHTSRLLFRVQVPAPRVGTHSFTQARQEPTAPPRTELQSHPGRNPQPPHRPERNPEPLTGQNPQLHTGQTRTHRPTKARTHSPTQARQKHRAPHNQFLLLRYPLSHFFCTRTFHIPNSPFRLEEHQGSSSFCLKVLPYIMVSHSCRFHPWGPIEPIQFPFHIACSLNICRQLSNRGVFSSQD